MTCCSLYWQPINMCQQYPLSSRFHCEEESYFQCTHEDVRSFSNVKYLRICVIQEIAHK